MLEETHYFCGDYLIFEGFNILGNSRNLAQTSFATNDYTMALWYPHFPKTTPADQVEPTAAEFGTRV